MGKMIFFSTWLLVLGMSFYYLKIELVLIGSLELRPKAGGVLQLLSTSLVHKPTFFFVIFAD